MTPTRIRTTVRRNKLMTCQMRRHIFCFFPVEYLTQFAMCRAERAKANEKITVRIAGKSLITTKRRSQPALPILFAKWAKNPKMQGIVTRMTISIKRKTLCMDLALSFSFFIVSSIELCFSTNSFHLLMGSCSSMTVECLWYSRIAFLTMPLVRKLVLTYWEAYSQWQIGPSV